MRLASGKISISLTLKGVGRRGANGRANAMDGKQRRTKKPAEVDEHAKAGL